MAIDYLALGMTKTWEIQRNIEFQNKVDAAEKALHDDIFKTLRELYPYGSEAQLRRNRQISEHRWLLSEIATVIRPANPFKK